MRHAAAARGAHAGRCRAHSGSRTGVCAGRRKRRGGDASVRAAPGAQPGGAGTGGAGTRRGGDRSVRAAPGARPGGAGTEGAGARESGAPAGPEWKARGRRGERGSSGPG
ncbi:hypothetical protein E6U81_24305 [Streptomyces sp. A0592]|nr:hypothetical protein E6U81_24305 [Streptomyces sp. A0592]